MPKKPTAADADIILKLYDIRREAEMRKARSWFGGKFWPTTVKEYMEVGAAYSIPENAWLRQVVSYWEMVAAMVLHGAINEELFMDAGVSGEMFFTFAKVYPFLGDLRKATGEAGFLANVEKVATRNKKQRERLDQMVKRVAEYRKSMAG